ncbi:helix-turn-helix domain-containing protein [Paenibacillus glycinis]|uniref:Response regulator n=1 Tax=Paenibacillus glycinis TaxID=2697035 RepID=A0ABW9XYL5_9BACL|nr:helix-turn-helix domain-containing protein [Paenibacillus glycinis]NBD27812.1 response regulator [Paenibacillus glycinis]
MFKVLVVDDEPFMIEGWKTMVDWHGCGYELCGTATDGEEAIASIKASSPDLVVTDIRMPVLDGLGLIRAMKEELGVSAKTVIVSGYSEFGYAQEALRYQVDRYVLKPLVAEEIHRVLLELAGPLEERRLAEASAGREELAAAAAAIVGVLKQGGAAAVAYANRLLGTDRQSRCRLLLAESTLGRAGGEALDSRLGSLMEAGFRQGLRAFAFEETPGQAGLLVLDEAEDGGEFEARLEEAATRQSWPLHGLALYCSGTACGLDSLPELLGQARELRRRAMFGRRAGVHLFRGARTLPEECRPQDVAARAEQLVSAIEAGDETAVRRSVASLLGLLASGDETGEWTAFAASHIRGELLRRFAALEADPAAGSEWTRRLLRESRPDAAEWSRETIEALCLRAASLLAERKSAPARSRAVAEAIAYLRAHVRDKIQLQALAERFGLSPVYFGQQFKRETGCCFNEYVHRLRIDEARKLLRRTDLKVSAIARTLGYHDTDYFTDKFKALTGELPSAYKNKRKGEGYADR